MSVPPGLGQNDPMRGKQVEGAGDGAGSIPGLGLMLAGAVMAAVALIAWSNRVWLASWVSPGAIATITLTTEGERDDARLQRAFDAARSAAPNEATLIFNYAKEGFRNSEAHVTGPSRAEAVAAAKAIANALEAAYRAEGRGFLDVHVRYAVDPQPGPAYDALLPVLAYGAALLGLAGVGLFWRGWATSLKNVSSEVRKQRWLGLLVVVFPCLPLAGFFVPGWVVMAALGVGFFAAVSAAIIYRTRRAQRASHWPSTRGRIVRSQMQRTKRGGGTSAPGIGNLADIEYVYSVAGVEYRGSRVGIGEIAPDSPEVAAALDRYRAGREGPVYYNPADPKDAVLERDMPASSALLYAGAAGVFLVGLAIVAAFTGVGDIVAWLQPYFPEGAFIPGALFFTAAGLVALLSLTAYQREATAAARWPRSGGKIIASAAESHRELSRSGGAPGTTITVWSPIVEFAYSVGGRDYHGARIAFGPSVSGGKDWAEAIVARYPVGESVVVSYDPANPAMAVLDPRFAFRWPALLVVAGFFVAAAYFSGLGKFL